MQGTKHRSDGSYQSLRPERSIYHPLINTRHLLRRTMTDQKQYFQKILNFYGSLSVSNNAVENLKMKLRSTNIVKRRYYKRASAFPEQQSLKPKQKETFVFTCRGSGSTKFIERKLTTFWFHQCKKASSLDTTNPW